MGGKRNLPRLSETQMALMDIVWRKGEATVTEVWKALPRGRRGAPVVLRFRPAAAEEGAAAGDIRRQHHRRRYG